MFRRFYHHHIIEGKMPATALCEAQKWLRDYLNSATTSNDAENTLKERMFQEIESECSLDGKPFEEPIFWVSFVLVGQ